VRVCFVSGNIYPLLAGRVDAGIPIIGGAETQQLRIARELTRAGVDVSFVSEDFGQGFDNEAGGFRVLAYTFGRNKLTQARTLWRALDCSGADVLYVRGVPRFIGWIVLYAVLRRRPLVIGMATNRTVFPRPLSMFSLPLDLAYRWALSRAAAVIAQTEFQRSYLAKNYRHAGAVVIRNGSPYSLARPAEYAARKCAVWIATLHPHKGIERLFELASLRPEIPFEIIGAPERGDRTYYEETMRRAQALANVRWLGIVPNENLDQLLSGALALIHTTLPHPGIPVNIHEGFPNVYLEAWRNGVPVLTLDTDPDDVICREGLGFHSRSIEEMARNLDVLCTSPETWGRMSSSAIRYFEREHAIERVGQEYLELFRRVLVRKGA